MDHVQFSVKVWLANQSMAAIKLKGDLIRFTDSPIHWDRLTRELADRKELKQEKNKTLFALGHSQWHSS